MLQNPIRLPDYAKSLALEKGRVPPFASAATIINISIPFFIWLSRLLETLPKHLF